MIRSELVAIIASHNPHFYHSDVERMRSGALALARVLRVRERADIEPRSQGHVRLHRDFLHPDTQTRQKRNALSSRDGLSPPRPPGNLEAWRTFNRGRFNDANFVVGTYYRLNPSP